MLKGNLLRALGVVAVVGIGSLQAGEVPPQADCSDFDHSGCAQAPGSSGDTCNEWQAASSCYALTGAPSSCDVVTVACTAAGCGSQQTITCEFSGVYNPDDVDCENGPGDCDVGGGAN